jgi:hypothetical protein
VQYLATVPELGLTVTGASEIGQLQRSGNGASSYGDGPL